ncbi:MAG: hypothetical protein GWP91_04695 [Rhodobacterales bacterium]|nr:hypothetical protein [Rhodobacterales bacterium]
MALLADASVNQAFFPLMYEPLDTTLLVSVNSVERLDGWIYDPQRMGIEFLTDVPKAYDEVNISYEALVEVEVTESGEPVE